MSIPISLNGLTGNEGWVLAEPIINNKGQVLYQENKLLDYATIEHLKNYYSKLYGYKNNPMNISVKVKFNLNEVIKNKTAVSDNVQKQNCDIEGNIPLELQDKTIKILREIYSNNNVNNTLNIINECVEELSQKIKNNPELSYSLGQYKENKNPNKGNMQDVTKHALRVAQFSITLASIYNKYVDDSEYIPLKDIATAALLHDYGLCFRDYDEIYRLRTIKLSDSFFKKYPTIPKNILDQPYQKKYKNVYAYAALKDVLNSYTLTSILLSNEDEKGISSLNITNDKLTSVNIAAKIIFLCNIYDSLLLNTISCNENLENVSTILEAFIANGIVNKTLGELFINNIPLYSVGVRVKLSNGQYATVIERFNGKDASKPIVQTLSNPPFIPETIDLRKTTNITIKNIIASSELLDNKIKEITKNQLESLGVTSIETYRNILEENNEIELVENKRR